MDEMQVNYLAVPVVGVVQFLPFGDKCTKNVPCISRSIKTEMWLIASHKSITH